VTIEPERDLLAVVVHELRSPVAALSAIAEVLSGGPIEGAERRELVRLTLAACRGIGRIAADATVTSVRLESLDVGPLAADAVAAARLEGFDVRAEIDPNLASVDADPERLRQALDNLVTNAVTHAPHGSMVVVRASMSEGRVLVSVSDLGPGIAPAEQERIFEPGIRLDTRQPGSGLGLAVTRAIACAHGGSVTVESVLGKGSTFTLALPVRR
jgi:signal transduction histidine kinase